MPVTVSAEEQLELLDAVFRELGAGEEASRIQSEILTEADLIGLPSHGLQRLPVLVERARKGLIRVDAEPVREWTAFQGAKSGRQFVGRWIRSIAVRRAISLF